MGVSRKIKSCKQVGLAIPAAAGSEGSRRSSLVWCSSPSICAKCPSPSCSPQSPTRKPIPYHSCTQFCRLFFRHGVAETAATIPSPRTIPVAIPHPTNARPRTPRPAAAASVTIRLHSTASFQRLPGEPTLLLCPLVFTQLSERARYSPFLPRVPRHRGQHSLLPCHLSWTSSTPLSSSPSADPTQCASITRPPRPSLITAPHDRTSRPNLTRRTDFDTPDNTSRSAIAATFTGFHGLFPDPHRSHATHGLLIAASRRHYRYPGHHI